MLIDSSEDVYTGVAKDADVIVPIPKSEVQSRLKLANLSGICKLKSKM